MRKRASARDQCERGVARTTKSPAAPRLRKGAVVNVYRLDPTGSPFIEGRGVIEGAYRRPHYFYVRMDGEKACRVRFVHPDWGQQNPEHFLALLRAFWEANLAPPVIDEFFPAPTSKGDVS